MRNVLAAFVAFALGGCSASTSLRLGAATSSVAPGVTVSTSSAGLGVQATSRAGALLGIGILVGAHLSAGGEASLAHTRAKPFSAINSSSAGALPFDDSRKVLVQDCTRPIEDWSANLRCR